MIDCPDPDETYVTDEMAQTLKDWIDAAWREIDSTTHSDG